MIKYKTLQYLTFLPIIGFMILKSFVNMSYELHMGILAVLLLVSVTSVITSYKLYRKPAKDRLYIMAAFLVFTIAYAGYMMF